MTTNTTIGLPPAMPEGVCRARAEDIYAVLQALPPQERLNVLAGVIMRCVVDRPEQVRVGFGEYEDERGTACVLEVLVDPRDVGHALGREGRIAKSIRTLLLASGAREGARVYLSVVGDYDAAGNPVRPERHRYNRQDKE